jgi:hypothetical protein
MLVKESWAAPRMPRKVIATGSLAAFHYGHRDETYRGRGRPGAFADQTVGVRQVTLVMHRSRGIEGTYDENACGLPSPPE